MLFSQWQRSAGSFVFGCWGGSGRWVPVFLCLRPTSSLTWLRKRFVSSSLAKFRPTWHVCNARTHTHTHKERVKMRYNAHFLAKTACSKQPLSYRHHRRPSHIPHGLLQAEPLRPPAEMCTPQIKTCNTYKPLSDSYDVWEYHCSTWWEYRKGPFCPLGIPNLNFDEETQTCLKTAISYNGFHIFAFYSN